MTETMLGAMNGRYLNCERMAGRAVGHADYRFWVRRANRLLRAVCYLNARLSRWTPGDDVVIG